MDGVFIFGATITIIKDFMILVMRWWDPVHNVYTWKVRDGISSTVTNNTVLMMRPGL